MGGMMVKELPSPQEGVVRRTPISEVHEGPLGLLQRLVKVSQEEANSSHIEQAGTSDSALGIVLSFSPSPPNLLRPCDWDDAHDL